MKKKTTNKKCSLIHPQWKSQHLRSRQEMDVKASHVPSLSGGGSLSRVSKVFRFDGCLCESVDRRAVKL
jgi:hypothetical protein